MKMCLKEATHRFGEEGIKGQPLYVKPAEYFVERYGCRKGDCIYEGCDFVEGMWGTCGKMFDHVSVGIYGNNVLVDGRTPGEQFPWLYELDWTEVELTPLQDAIVRAEKLPGKYIVIKGNGQLIPGLVAAIDINIGCSLVKANDPTDVLVCAHGKLSPEVTSGKRMYSGTLERVFINLVDMLETGVYDDDAFIEDNNIFAGHNVSCAFSH